MLHEIIQYLDVLDSADYHSMDSTVTNQFASFLTFNFMPDAAAILTRN
jgi:hypothetical protein